MGLGQFREEWFWLEHRGSLAIVAGENFGLWVILSDVPESPMNQDDFDSSHCLEDCPTLQTGCQFTFQVEWVWLNSGSPAIDMTFQDPTLAPGALFQLWHGIDE